MAENYLTVNDFMQNMKMAPTHDIFRMSQTQAKLLQDHNAIDMREIERESTGISEKNILTGLNIDNKFVMKGMNENLPLKIYSLAKQVVKTGGGEGSKKNIETKNFNYNCGMPIKLESEKGNAIQPDRPGIIVERDKQVRNKILSACPNMSPNQMENLVMIRVGEKLNCNTDMRHTFMKGYLMLQDYNLGMTAGVTERGMTPEIVVNEVRATTSMERLIAISHRKIVLDKSSFTSSERGLLTCMMSEYPLVQYADNNVYNGFDVDADDYTWVGEGDIDIDENFSFGSPDRMYFDMVNIACKLGCLGDMFEVFSAMRGLPFLLHEINKYEGVNKFKTHYPPSHCLRTALGLKNDWTDFVQHSSNYFSTSKALVADLILGECLKYAVFALGEELGAYGELGCPTKQALNDPVLGSNCRDWGLKHETEIVNTLLQEWRGIRGCKMPVGFEGGLKRCVTWVANGIRNDPNTLPTYITPQVGFEIPFSNCKHTAWGAVRGYEPMKTVQTKGKEQVKAKYYAQAFKFMMGVRKKVPMIGMNGVGTLQTDVMSVEEMDFDHGGEGTYAITNVNYSLAVNVTARTDEMEVSATSFHQTLYLGTRCTIINDERGVDIIKKEGKELPTEHQTIGKQTIKKSEFDNGNSASGIPDLSKKYSFGGSNLPKLPPKVTPTETKGVALSNLLKVGRKIGKPNIKVHEPPESPNIDGKGHSLNNAKFEPPFNHLYSAECEPVRKGKIYFQRQPTSGQGLECLLHAAGQDLALRGMLNEKELINFKEWCSTQLGGEGPYDALQGAKLWNEKGFGLTILSKLEGGRWHAANYGTKDSVHNIRLALDRGHFENLIPGGNEMFDIINDEEGNTPSEMLEQIKTVADVIDSEDMINRRRKPE